MNKWEVCKKHLVTITHLICLQQYSLFVRRCHDIYDGFKWCLSDFVPSCSVVVCEVVELLAFYPYISACRFLPSLFVIQLTGKYFEYSFLLSMLISNSFYLQVKKSLFPYFLITILIILWCKMILFEKINNILLFSSLWLVYASMLFFCQNKNYKISNFKSWTTIKCLLCPWEYNEFRLI